MPSDTLPSDLFSFAGLLPAKTSAPQITARVECSATGCSLQPPSLSSASALRGLRLRTAISSRLEAMTKSQFTWNAKVTSFGRPYSALRMPARPIGVPDVSSSDGFLPTPRAHKGGLPDSHGDVSAWMHTPTVVGNHLAPEMAKWAGAWTHFIPTPTAQDYGSNKGGAAGRTGPERPSLSTLARAWGLSGRQSLAAIYEHMMGFPIGWLSELEAPTETASSPRSPKSSAKRSSK